MAFVGFLTFGFTQVVCPRPPLSYRVETINNGYVVIHGWAYLLASWNDHPPIAGVSDKATNVIYDPINAGGKDASFLFQNINQNCASIITPKSSGAHVGQGDTPSYFPCQLIEHNQFPSSLLYSNQSACHLKPTSRGVFESMRDKGVLNENGKYDKAGRVYYDWNDVNTTAHLAVYNSYVLNLNLLQSLPQSVFSVPTDGLIQSILQNTSAFGGQDITHTVATRKTAGSTTWKAEAECLLDTIKVGEIDTKSFGCIASDVVLYTSLIVILGVILVKFGLAVIFGWFLSWKLGNFKKEGKTSYKDRMRRDLEIEDWTTGINVPAAAIRPHTPQQQLYGSPQAKKKGIMPRKSRFTQPDTGSMHFNAIERPGSTIWRQSTSNSRIFGNHLNSSTGALSPRPTGSTSENGRSVTGSPLSRRSSETSHSSHTELSQLTTSCPYELSPHALRQPKPDYMPFGFTLAHTICLVTCYSEGEEGLRTTLDSIATTDYPNSHKLILVVADGMITGHGNAMSTPDICISMMKDFLVEPDTVEACSYVAIADGTKRHNMAKIYSGFYKYDDKTVDRGSQQRVPMITIVKCGTPEEQDREAKPGNRGKRDSQVILMSFLQKVMFDERMTELEYEFFTNIWRIAGVSPDKYEIVLMVDADTKVYPDALSRLISCMVNDSEVMGLCGETKIGNKTDSWVSMIQVFEYYISHHQSKAFESIFGNVTCLPGCFCMYRIKAPKGNNGHWVPILANPDIIEHYSENVVDTLHKKNLLLLGEDRYLSTLMLKTFPRRKMLFVPQAVCKTVVPDSFMVLLSQRRRWINSTIHNLMELVFVRDLCGTFCFSMQFVVFMELVGTLALPAAISFTMYLIILACIGQPAVLSLILLALILGLPAVLIVMTSRKLVYVGWMFIYLFSLPIWNFVLPTYAYWHFDDFTWGETRKVEGEGKDNHGDKEGEFDSSQITMKKWTEFERERKIREAEARSRALVQQHLSSPLSRWSPTNLSFEIDRSTLSTLIGSSMGTSPRFVLPNPSNPPPTPATPHNASQAGRTSNTQGLLDDDIDGHSILSDETEEIRQWRRSQDFFGGGIERMATIDTNLPAISNEDEGDDDNWQTSIMETIHNKDVKVEQDQEPHQQREDEEQEEEEKEKEPPRVSLEKKQDDTV
ncbi:chitin synthase-domain-containing protein [Parasitella parasitica]|nr:chitin synthase-domain-containing protein [Parasitella parasitica]